MAVMGSDRGLEEGRGTTTAASELLTGRNGHGLLLLQKDKHTGGISSIGRGGTGTGGTAAKVTLTLAGGGTGGGGVATGGSYTGQKPVTHTDSSSTTHIPRIMVPMPQPWRRGTSLGHANNPHIHRLVLTILLVFLCSTTTMTLASGTPHSSDSVDSGRTRRDLPPPPDTDSADPTDPEGSTQEAGFTVEDETRLKEFVQHVRSAGCSDVPSVAVAVVDRRGKKTTSWAVGEADLDRGVRATSHTHYCVASLSKAFTATLLVKLLDRKGKSLDDTVMSILGGKYPFMEEYVTSHVTIRDLLLHRTGIPRYDYLWISGAPDVSAIFRRLRCMKHSHEFRTAALYNNILYALAGHVTEEIGGASWEELLRTELLEPLGMTSTTFIKDIYSGPYNNTKAEQYMWVNGTNVHIGDPIHRGAADITPAIGVYSTAEDMGRWVEFHLSRGKNKEGHQLIPRNLMDDMHKGQVSADLMMKPELVSEDGSQLLTYDMYGLAWYTGYHRGHRVVMHFGSYPGFYSMITLLPGKGFGIFSTINGGHMERPYTINSAIHTYAIDLALDIPKDRLALSQNICENQRAQMPKNCNDDLGKYTIPGRHLAKYTGIYVNPAYGNLSMVQKEGIIYMMFNDIHFVASPLNDMTFCIVPTKTEQKMIFFPQNISFSLNIYQELDSLTVSFLGFDNIFYKLPPDIMYDDWINEKCGMPQPPCHNGEQLPAVQASAATLSPKVYFVSLMIFSSLLL